MREAVVHIVLLVFAPLLLAGVIQKTKAVFAGRKGAPLLQPYLDVWKLLRKGAVYSTTTTWVFRAGPIVGLATALAAGLVVPLHAARGPLGFEGDVIAFAYLLGLGRFFTMAAALDTGSSFEGMGASREAAFSTLAEPALFLALAVVCVPAGSASFEEAWKALSWQARLSAHPELLTAALALFAVLLAENSRIPVDDPNTHLELTMIHEVMVLDHSGPDLGFILYGAALKLWLFAAVLVGLLLPIATGNPWLDAAVVVLAVFAVGVLVAIVASTMARLQLLHVSHLLVGSAALVAMALMLTLGWSA
jgi:formate hydrogenlyase subunit 4